MKKKPTSSGRGPNYVFVGIEEFLLEEELSRIKQSIDGDELMNWNVFNADEPSRINADEIVALCNTLPFLASRRAVVIRNAQNLKADQAGRIASYMDDPCDATTLVLCLDMVDSERGVEGVLRAFKGRADIVRFEPMKDKNERIRWILERARGLGKTMERDAAAMLAETAGTSLWQLKGEIEKLCLYVGHNPTVTIQDVREVAMGSVEPAVFAFLDSLFERRKDAIVRLGDLEGCGVSDLELTGRLENEIIVHYVVLTGQDARKLKIHDFRIQKASRRKHHWNGDELLELLGETRRIEQGIKSSASTGGYGALAELVGRVVLGHRS